MVVTPPFGGGDPGPNPGPAAKTGVFMATYSPIVIIDR